LVSALLGLTLTTALCVSTWRHVFSRDPVAAPDKHASDDSIAALALESLENGLTRLENERDGSAQDTARLRGELRALRERLTRLDEAQASMARHLEELGAGGALAESGAFPDAASGAAADVAPAPTEEQIAKTARAATRTLEETFTAEPPDPEWAGRAELALTETYRNSEELPGVNLLGAECRSTLCVLEVGLDGDTSPGEAYSDLVFATPWPGESFIAIDEATGAALLYLAREGHSLPRAGE
jgi:hypothetical protein